MNFPHLLGRTLVGLLAMGVVSSAVAQDSRLVVKTFQPGQGAEVARQYGLRLLGTSVDGKRALLDARSTVNASLYRYILSSDPSVEKVDHNNLLNLGSQSGKGSTIPVIGVDPAMEDVNDSTREAVEDVAVTSTRTVKVAILDTGLNQGSVLWGSVAASRNFLNTSAAALDAAQNIDSDGDGKRDESLGHGSTVAGVVKMMAPNASLIIAKVADADGMATTWNMLNAVDYALAQGAEVINISLGSTFTNEVFADVVNRAEAAGAVIVAAIGNDEAAYALFPSSDPKVICVSGVGAGDIKDENANWSAACDVSAPISGYAVQADGTLGTWTGTSFSAAIVSGGLAKVLSGTVPQTPTTVRSALSATGANLDWANPEYAGQLGTRLNVSALAEELL